MTRMKKGERRFGPVSTILIFTILICVASFILSMIDFGGYQTSFTNGVLADSLIRVRNIFSSEGIKFVIGNAVTNFRNFSPLVLFIISMIGIGICEKSGFFNILFAPLRKIKFGVIVYLTILISLLSSVLGEYSYAFLIPLIGTIYKYLDRNAILGILISFLSITLGYGTGLFFSYGDYSLSLLTQAAAAADVDPNFVYSMTSTTYIMLTSMFLLSIILYIIISKFLVSKFPIKAKNEEELNDSKHGFALAFLTLIFATLVVIYMILDIKLPLAGILLDHSNSTYVAKLFGDNAPFKEGIVIIISAIMMITGFVYGKTSGNIKTSGEYSLGLSKSFENLGLLFVLLFFTSQLYAILDWTNIGDIVATNLTSFISNLELSGVMLIVTFFILVILMSILIPDTYTKWKLVSPVMVPLFMRSNLSPQFTQFIFQIGDSVGKAFCPFYVYLIATLAFLQKYNTDENTEVSLFGVFKMILPTVLLTGIFFALFLSLWHLIGFPIGVGVYTTL